MPERFRGELLTMGLNKSSFLYLFTFLPWSSCSHLASQRDACSSEADWCVGCSVEKYQEQFSFLRDSRFIQDLENDSVDSDLIEEELRALRESAIRFQLFSSFYRYLFTLMLYMLPLSTRGLTTTEERG